MFRDRSDAGRQLARLLGHYADREDVVVLGIPRGGVPVAFEVARKLNVPLDVLIVRKLGAPGQEELAVGAIASGKVRFMNDELVRELALTEEEIAGLIQKETLELERRERLYRGARPELSVRGKIAILVDDGIATGASTQAAVAALRLLGPEKIVVATPVAPEHAQQELSRRADEFVAVTVQEFFFAIGQFYDDFSQVEDAEVRKLLERSDQLLATPAGEKRGAA